jgi:sugar lactone lactonase YvrE
MALTLFLLVSSAGRVFADTPSESESRPPLPTSQEVGEAIASQNGKSIEPVLTDSSAAEALPHQDLNRDEALELMQAVFESELQAPAGVFDELQVEKFLSDHAAVVPAGQQPGEAPTLLESTVPMRTEGSSGEEDPVDLTLEHAGGELQSSNPLVEVGVPQELGDGIELPESGIRIELEGAPQERSPSTIDDSVAVYPNVAEDSDFAVAPTPTAVETLTQLRSVDAPHAETFALDLPQGTTLRPTEGGGAEVSRGDETLIVIPPPIAIDATGAEVPVRLEVAGDSMTLEAIPSQSTQFPILVDPLFQSYEWLAKNNHNGVSFTGGFHEEWSPEQANGFGLNDHVPESYWPLVSGWQGLYVVANGSEKAGTQGSWNYTVPRYFSDYNAYGTRPTSFISNMTLSNLVWRTWGSYPSPYLWSALWDPNSGFVSFLSHEGGDGHSLTDMSWQYQFANPNANTNVKIAVVGVHATEASSGSGQRLYVGTATMELSETANDVPGFGSVSGPSQWVDQTASPISFTASDSGLGIYAITVKDEQSPQHSWKTSYGCTGVAGNPCPRTWKSTDTGHPALKYEPALLPQGIDYLELTAEDPLGHLSQPAKVQVKVDHSAPELALSGSLTEQAKLGSKQQTYALALNGTDGTSESPQSGVAKSVIKVDGKVADESNPGCATQNCTLAREWTLDANDYSVGQHTIEATVLDAVGLSTTKSLTINLQPEPHFTFSGSITEQATLGTARPHYNLKVSASGEAGSGSQPITAEIKLDGTLVSSGEASCTQQACSISPEWTLDTTAYAAGQHTVAVTVHDGAGNSGTRTLPITLNPDHTAPSLSLSGSLTEQATLGTKLPTYTLALKASDGTSESPQSGVARSVIKFDGTVVDEWTPGCATQNCTLTREGTFDASYYAAGQHKVEVIATDEVGLSTSKSLTIEFRPEPRFTFSGSMTEQGALGTARPHYSLKVNASGEGPDESSPFAQLSSFGSEGSGNGQFQHPGDVAIDASGNVWVADTYNSRIEEFTANGEFIRKFGSEGSGNGQLRSPASLTIDASGNVWVADTGNSRVQEFSTKGELIGQLGSEGSEEGQLSYPSAIALDTSGNVWVADTYNNRIEEFSEAGELIRQFGEGQLNSPLDIALDSSGNVWVADTYNSRIEEFTEEGELVRQFVAESDHLIYPAAIALGSAGKVWIADSNYNEIEEFTEEGEYLAKFGSSGSGTGQLTLGAPVGIATGSGGDLWVADAGNNRIVRWGAPVISTEIAVDGKAVYSAAASCLAGACSASPGWMLESGGYSAGKHTVAVTVTDGVGNRATKTLSITLNPDHSAPSLSLSGSLTEQATLGTKLPTYTLGLKASDGTSESPQSGVASTAIKVDGKVVSEAAPGCATQNCSVSREWTLDSSEYAAGQHTVEVTATDEAGLQATKSLLINLHPAPRFTLAGSITEQASLGTTRPRYHLKVSATGEAGHEPGAPMSDVASFGSEGSGNGQFQHPGDVAIDAKGNVWVADTYNSRIEEFTANGEFIRKFGSEGSGNGQLSGPAALAIDAKSNVWVADTYNSRIEEFSEGGEFIRKFGSAGSGNGQLSYPYDLAVNAGGNVFVADTENSRVEVFTESGAFVRTIGSPGWSNGQLSHPFGLTLGPEGNLYIADTYNDRIEEFSEAGGFVRILGTEGQFNSPVAIALGIEGEAWVADAGQDRVKELSSEDEYLTEFGSEQLSFNAPMGIASGPAGNVWLTDTASNQVERWEPEYTGTPIATEIAVDGKAVDEAEAECSAEGCSVSPEWTLASGAYAAGKHDIAVTVTDGAGNSATKSLPVEVQRDTTKPTLQVSGELFEAPEGWVEQESYGLHASATDGGYGVTSLAFKIDGTWVSSSEQGCADGDCEDSLAKQIDMAPYSGGSHPAEIVATDGAGNTTIRHWTINVDPEGHISAAEAEETLEAADITTESMIVASTNEVISAEEQEDGNDPSLVEGKDALASNGVPDLSMIATNPVAGFTIQTPIASVHAEPTTVGGGATEMVVAEEAAAISANTTFSVDTIIRPTFNGVMLFQSIRDASSPESYSWTVPLSGGETLKSIDPRDAEIDFEDGTEVMLITAEFAHDAIGKEVPTTLSVSDENVLTLTVAHRGSPFAYPVVAGSGWEGGFSTEIVTRPQDEQELREERERIEREEREAREQAEQEMEGGGGDEPPGEGLEVWDTSPYRPKWIRVNTGAPEMIDWVHRFRRSKAEASYCAKISCGYWHTWELGTWFWNGTPHHVGGEARRGNTAIKCFSDDGLLFADNLLKIGWSGPHPAPYGYGAHLNLWCNFHVTWFNINDLEDNYYTEEDHLYGDGYQGQHIKQYYPGPIE